MDIDEIESILAARMSPALHLIPTLDNSVFSKLGGNPTVSDDFMWPRWNDKSLAFLAQLDFSELPKSCVIENMPESGRLYFFYDQEQSTWGFDPKDKGSWQVIYVSASNNISNTTAPQDVSVDYQYEERQVTFTPISSYCATESLEMDLDSLSDVQWEAIEDIRYMGFKGEPHHQIGGFPDAVQNDDMDVQCQLTSNGIYLGDSTYNQDPNAVLLMKGASDWQLLLQIDTDEDLGMMWGDCGLLYFWIRKQDIAVRDFSNVWMILQCS